MSGRLAPVANRSGTHRPLASLPSSMLPTQKNRIIIEDYVIAVMRWLERIIRLRREVPDASTNAGLWIGGISKHIADANDR
jgi:hypothetical protein